NGFEARIETIAGGRVPASVTQRPGRDQWRCEAGPGAGPTTRNPFNPCPKSVDSPPYLTMPEDKRRRQALLSELIESGRFRTQEELAEELTRRGLPVRRCGPARRCCGGCWATCRCTSTRPGT